MSLGGRNDLFGFGGPPTSSGPDIDPGAYWTPPSNGAPAGAPGAGWFGGASPGFGGFTGAGFGTSSTPNATADPFTPTSTTSGGATSVGDSVRKRHRKDKGQGDGRARPGRGGGGGDGLSTSGRVLVGCLIGGVLARSFEVPGGWALGSTAGGLVAYFGGELWMTR